MWFFIIFGWCFSLYITWVLCNTYCNSKTQEKNSKTQEKIDDSYFSGKKHATEDEQCKAINAGVGRWKIVNSASGKTEFEYGIFNKECDASIS